MHSAISTGINLGWCTILFFLTDGTGLEVQYFLLGKSLCVNHSMLQSFTWSCATCSSYMLYQGSKILVPLLLKRNPNTMLTMKTRRKTLPMEPSSSPNCGTGVKLTLSGTSVELVTCTRIPAPMSGDQNVKHGHASLYLRTILTHSNLHFSSRANYSLVLYSLYYAFLF